MSIPISPVVWAMPQDFRPAFGVAAVLGIERVVVVVAVNVLFNLYLTIDIII